MGRRRRRPLPGEGSDRLGSNFDRGLPGSGAPDEEIVYNVGGAGLGSLGQYAAELEALAIEYRRNLEVGHIPMRYAVASMLALPRLRAFWPFTSIDENGDIVDLAGQGRHLSVSSATIGSSGLGGYVPVASFAGGSKYFSRADETGLNWDGLSGASFVGWVFPGWSTQDFTYAPLATKGDGNTGIEYGFHVRRNSMRIRVMAGNDSWLAPVSLNHNEWNFVAAGVFGVAGLVIAYCNGEYASDSMSPGTLSSTTDPFYIGRYDDGGNTEYWDGLMALPALCDDLTGEDVLDGIFEGTRRAFGV